MADCSAFVTLPLVALASKSVLGEDLLAAAGIDWKGYARADRRSGPRAQRVDADRKADRSAWLAAAKKRPQA